jgi:pimeloyl-ACP methyl ester carboxylesterase
VQFYTVEGKTCIDGFPRSAQPFANKTAKTGALEVRGRLNLASAAIHKVSRPSLFLALTEFPRALAEFGSMPWAGPILMQAEKGDGHPVMLLPGFLAGDYSMKPLKRYLDNLGYTTFHWELGRNLGPRAIGHNGEKLIARLEEIHAETGKKVSLVGWSLGGTLARQLSRRRPNLVRQVISLGSPITGSPKSTNAWRAYQVMTGQKVDDPDVQAQLAESHDVPPVPSTAIFSKHDGIVAWQNSREPRAKHTDNIEVRGSHCGLGVNPAVLWAIADRLALPEKGWTPFERSGLKSFVYPSSGH